MSSDPTFLKKIVVDKRLPIFANLSIWMLNSVEEINQTYYIIGLN